MSRRTAVAALALLAVAPLVVLALYPPAAFDETLYHLPLVRLLAQGKFGFHEELRFPLFPMLAEVLAVPAYLFGGDTATHLVPLLAMLLTVVVLVKWARLHGVPPLAAAAFAGAPIVVRLATVMYVDIVLTAFIVAGFYCLDRASSRNSSQLAARSSQETPHGLGSPARCELRAASWSLAAGLFLGAACDVKYLAGYFVAVAFIVAVIRKRAAWFVAGAVIAAGPMYLWLYLTTGDPLFPFFLDNPWKLARTPIEPAWTVLRLPWDVVFARHRVNWQPPFTPFFALALIVLCIASLREKRPRFVLLFAVGYLLIFTHLPQDSRYLVPLLPLVLMEASLCFQRVVLSRSGRSSGAKHCGEGSPADSATSAQSRGFAGDPSPRCSSHWRAAAAAQDDTAKTPRLAKLFDGVRRWKRSALGITALLTFAFIPGPAYAVYRIIRNGPRSTYVERTVPEIRALRAAGNSRVYVCGGEELKALATGPLLGDHAGPYAYDRILDHGRDPARIHRELRRIHVDMLLILDRKCPPMALAPPGFTLVYEDAVAKLWRVER